MIPHCRCRKEQSVMDECVLNNLKVERPKLGYFSKPHVHDSPVAAPVRKVRDYKAEAAQVRFFQASMVSRYLWYGPQDSEGVVNNWMK